MSFNKVSLQDEELLLVKLQESRIKKKRIIGNSAKGKYSTPGVNTNASVN